MKVRDIMSATVDSIDARTTISHAARRMADDDIGALPVLSEGKLVGIVTDRDIIVRAVAEGLPGSATIRRVMTPRVECCAPGDDVCTVLALMSREQVRRMPVCNADDDVIGIVSLADAAKHAPDKNDVAATLADICEPHGQHCQSTLFA
jgi:CBS domain-containing protein